MSSDPQASPPKSSEDHASAATPSGKSGAAAANLNANAKSFVPGTRLGDGAGAPPPPLGGAGSPSHRGGRGAGAHAGHHMPPPPPPMMGMFGVPPLIPGVFPPMSPMMPSVMSPLAPVALGGMAPLKGAVPPSPLAFAPPAGRPPAFSATAPPPPSTGFQVSVGNASLAALRSTAPPKFACVLLVGLPRVGKTSMGRRVIQQLQDDGMKWSFFSGGDYIKDPTARASPWMTTKDIFDALSLKLDEQLSKQPTDPIRGLVIDKQCRGTEELYYLTAVLRSKGLSLNGIVGLECEDDLALATRLGTTEEDGFREKLKYHRVILTRIKETAKAANLWHAVDALQSEAEVSSKMRSMILGCSAQAPARQLVASAYHESLATMIDNYATFSSVMNTLMSQVKVSKPGQYPGFSNYVPVTKGMLAEPKQNRRGQVAAATNLRECCVRRKTDGTKYVLVFDGSAMYLVPRHMRCVFLLSSDAWLGAPLTNVGKFVIEGELVRLTKERHKEKLIVTDVLSWCDKGNPTNAVARSTWLERQEKLKTQLCNETTAFFPKGDIVVVHQSYEKFPTAVKLLETHDYPTEGLVFVQPASSKREDPQFLWRPPESITVDFRLGALVKKTEQSATYVLEVFDQRVAKYAQFNQDTVEVPLPRPFAIEGAVAICGLDPTSIASDDAPAVAAQPPRWIFHRTRSDVTTAAFKDKVDELLVESLISRGDMHHFLTPVEAPVAPVEAQAATSAAAPAPSYAAAAASSSARGAFGSALHSDKAAAASASRPATTASSQQLAASVLPPGSADINLLRQVVDGRVTAHKDVETPPPAKEEGRRQRAAAKRDEDETSTARKCRECSSEVEEHDGQVDDRDRRFYCYACWDKLGYNICNQCKSFAKGHREEAPRRGQLGTFYCEECWTEYEKKKRRAAAAAAAAAPKAEKAEKSEKAERSKESGGERKPKSESSAPAKEGGRTGGRRGKKEDAAKEGDATAPAPSTQEAATPAATTTTDAAPTTAPVEAATA